MSELQGGPTPTFASLGTFLGTANRTADAAVAVAGVPFDIDGLDPSAAPGTGTPEIGGLHTWQARGIVSRLRGVDFVGMDLVEVAPAYDVGEISALAGASMVCFDMGLLVERGIGLKPTRPGT